MMLYSSRSSFAGLIPLCPPHYTNTASFHYLFFSLVLSSPCGLLLPPLPSHSQCCVVIQNPLQRKWEMDELTGSIPADSCPESRICLTALSAPLSFDTSSHQLCLRIGFCTLSLSAFVLTCEPLATEFRSLLAAAPFWPSSGVGGGFTDTSRHVGRAQAKARLRGCSPGITPSGPEWPPFPPITTCPDWTKLTSLYPHGVKSSAPSQLVGLISFHWV